MDPRQLSNATALLVLTCGVAVAQTCPDVELFAEDFNGGVMPPGWSTACWDIGNGCGDHWEIQTQCFSPCMDGGRAVFDPDQELQCQMWNVGGSHLFTPWFDLPPVGPGERVVVDFCLRVDPDVLPEQDHLAVENTLGPDLVFDLWGTVPPYDVTAVAGSTVRLRWSCPGQGSHNFRLITAIDNVRVHLEPQPPCPTFCFGTACPCGNDDPLAGCVNSTGQGALLAATGAPSIAADSLVLTATGCPPDNTGLAVMGGSIFAPVLSGDGLLCTGGLYRFFPGTVDGAGVFVETSLVASAPPGSIGSGDTRHFQLWTRDVLCGPPPAPCTSPCGSNSNLSNGVSVTFVP